MSALYTFSEKVSFIESVLGKVEVSKDGVNICAKCPFCTSDKGKRKLIIKVDHDLTHCWVCGFKSRSLVPIIKKISSNEKLAEYVKKFSDSKNNFYLKNNLDDKIPEKEKLKLPDDFRLITLANRDPDTYAIAKYLIKDRKLDLDDLWKWRLGISDQFEFKRRVIIPSFDKNGELNHYVTRSIDNMRYPYMQAKNDKLAIIFNEIAIDWSDKLVICEGPFDAFKCGDNVTCLLGSELNENSYLFNQILVHNTPIALALDSDMRERKVPYIAAKLAEYNIEVNIVELGDYKDPGLMTKKEFKRVLDNSIKPTWENEFLRRLNTL